MKAIDDYLNGNLTDAKEAARFQAWRNIFRSAMDEYGKTSEAAMAIANFLKGEGTFQAACDAEAKSKASGLENSRHRYDL